MIVISVMFSGRCMVYGVWVYGVWVYGVWVYGVWAEDTATLVSLPINYTL
ncbi:MAG: hypothetical protein IKV31_04890 [Paludibacteraceae bacterium]|nr:hypothetical protein [Paludibacteraceae bacterium]